MKATFGSAAHPCACSLCQHACPLSVAQPYGEGPNGGRKAMSGLQLDTVRVRVRIRVFEIIWTH